MPLMLWIPALLLMMSAPACIPPSPPKYENIFELTQLGFWLGRFVLPVTFHDISAGQGAASGTTPNVVVDAVNRKILAVARNDANSTRISLFRCELNGTGCTHTDISAGQPATSGYYPSTAIDTVNSKLLVATTNANTSYKLSLFRCNLDGSSCTHLDVSAAVYNFNSSGLYPSIAIDSTNSRVLVVTQDTNGGNKVRLFRCDLNPLGNCATADISAGQGNNTGFNPSLAVDAANGKILVAGQMTDPSTQAAGPAGVGLYRCDLTGAGCTFTDLGLATGFASNAGVGRTPSVAVDPANAKVLVVTKNQSNREQLSLFRCSLSVTGCAHIDISAGQSFDGHIMPRALVDSTNGKLLVTAQNFKTNNRPSFFGCNVDGTNCAHYDLASALSVDPADSGLSPQIAMDQTSGRILVATSFGPNSNRPGLFRFPLNFLGQ